ncbi:MAG: pro-sigmaK processing inhibitor BofA family protein [Clostridiaceae bacterium]|nr:pro-sigmaK processing inhibitor BofA family protein [Clostridiaceae bacterium]
MENTIFIVLFIGGFMIFLASLGVDVIKVAFNFVIRCLLCLIIINIANYVIEQNGANFVVNINEISMGVSGIFGVWGVIFLYVLQYYFTIT